MCRVHGGSRRRRRQRVRRRRQRFPRLSSSGDAPRSTLAPALSWSLLLGGRPSGTPRTCVGRGDARLALCRPCPRFNMIIPVRCFTCGKVIGTWATRSPCSRTPPPSAGPAGCASGWLRSPGFWRTSARSRGFAAMDRGVRWGVVTRTRSRRSARGLAGVLASACSCFVLVQRGCGSYGPFPALVL